LDASGLLYFPCKLLCCLYFCCPWLCKWSRFQIKSLDKPFSQQVLCVFFISCTLSCSQHISALIKDHLQVILYEYNKKYFKRKLPYYYYYYYYYYLLLVFPWLRHLPTIVILTQQIRWNNMVTFF
jgi:hypothetical protein